MNDQATSILLKICGKFSITLWFLQLFQRCLVKVLSIDLWKLYLNYIKDTKGKLPSYRYVQKEFTVFLAILNIVVHVSDQCMYYQLEKNYLSQLFYFIHLNSVIMNWIGQVKTLKYQQNKNTLRNIIKVKCIKTHLV